MASKSALVPRPLMPLARLRGAANGTLLANAGSMIGATLVTSGFGAIFWLLAARLFSHTAVGLGGASISAMALLGNAGMLGLGTLLIGQLPRHRGHERQIIAAALMLSGTAGAILGLVFALVAPLVSPNLAPLRSSILGVVLFASGVALTSVTAVLDQALIGLLRGGLQLWRNALFATTKLGILLAAGLWLSDAHWLTIYGAWLAGNLVSLAALLATTARKYGWAALPRFRSGRYPLRGFGLQALGHHWLNLGLQIPGFALPVVVTAVRSSSENAYFYMATMVAGLVFYGPLALVTALYAVGARDPDGLAHRTRFTLKLALAAGVLVNAVLLIGADRLLGFFGPAYAQQAGLTLRIMGLTVFPVIIKDHYVTINRVRGRVTRTAIVTTAGGVFELILAAAFGVAATGLWGFAAGWLLALCVEAACMAPFIYRVIASTAQSAAIAA